MKTRNDNSTNKEKIQIKDKTQKIVWIVNVVIAVLISYFFLHLLSHQKYKLIFLAKDFLFQQIISSFLFFISCVLMIHGFLSDWRDISNKDNCDIYRCHKNIMNNTILWSIIFWGALLYDRTKATSVRLQVELVDMFLLSRVIFSIGYVVGTVVKHQSLRAIGFGITFTCVTAVILRVFGIDLTKIE